VKPTTNSRDKVGYGGGERVLKRSGKKTTEEVIRRKSGKEGKGRATWNMGMVFGSENAKGQGKSGFRGGSNWRVKNIHNDYQIRKWRTREMNTAVSLADDWMAKGEMGAGTPGKENP